MAGKAGLWEEEMRVREKKVRWTHAAESGLIKKLEEQRASMCGAFYKRLAMCGHDKLFSLAFSCYREAAAVRSCQARA